MTGTTIQTQKSPPSAEEDFLHSEGLFETGFHRDRQHPHLEATGLLTIMVALANVIILLSERTRMGREALQLLGFRAAGGHSHSMVATGFSLMSHSTRFTPGTVAMIRSRMVHRTEKGISGTVAVTASKVLTARITTAQPI